ncbi:MAG: signal peptidase I [Desulfobacterales bacterium]
MFNKMTVEPSAQVRLQPGAEAHGLGGLAGGDLVGLRETLKIGDHILVNKFIYGVKLPFLQTTIIPVTNPKRGDIVVFKFPEDPSKDFIKRVIGVAGDVIQIRNKKVYVNHKLLNHDHGIHTDSYIFPANVQPRDNFGPVVVPPNSLFVMGDNRDQSYDSRFWGFVKLKAVLGKALLIYWSWDSNHCDVRWNRIGHILK